jgi:uncharacterized protein (TIGR00369 family)
MGSDDKRQGGDAPAEKPVPGSRAFIDAIPHNRALGMRMRELRRAEAVFELPYDAKLVGNPDTGVLHGGAITALLDACSGAAVFAALTAWQPIATLDLRIDYMRGAEVGRAIVCRAHCYKLTRNVAFTRAVAYHDDEADPIATSMGTFMIGTKAGGPRSAGTEGGSR